MLQRDKRQGVINKDRGQRMREKGKGAREREKGAFVLQGQRTASKIEKRQMWSMGKWWFMKVKGESLC